MTRRQNKLPRAKIKKHPSSSRSALNHSVQLVHQVCCIAGAHSLIEDIRSAGAPNTLGSMIERRDTPGLFNWLVIAFSYQGISDRVAASYIEEHGSISWSDIESGLRKKQSCPKLKSYWHFEKCGYLKAKRTCSCPEHLSNCPLPKRNLRNGRLNQTSFGLFFLLRDLMGSDLVGWMDARISSTPKGTRAAQKDALLVPFKRVHGISDKVLEMAFASVLLAAPKQMSAWRELGGRLIAVDSLVHAWLHRTGILKRFSAGHPYGPRCYEQNGCAEVLEKIAVRIDAKEFNKNFPSYFPRFVQYAIWRFCAQEGLDVCNSNRIDDRKRCENRWCRLFRRCDRRSVSSPVTRR